jgi:DnaK suppressor protein
VTDRPAAPRELLTAERASALARLAGLEREFTGLVESSGQAGTDEEHDPEGATLAFEREHVAALLGQARGRLTEIEAALRKLDEGGYGVCDGCGQPIGAARLAARPATPLCLRCAARTGLSAP